MLQIHRGLLYYIHFTTDVLASHLKNNLYIMKHHFELSNLMGIDVIIFYIFFCSPLTDCYD